MTFTWDPPPGPAPTTTPPAAPATAAPPEKAGPKASNDQSGVRCPYAKTLTTAVVPGPDAAITSARPRDVVAETDTPPRNVGENGANESSSACVTPSKSAPVARRPAPGPTTMSALRSRLTSTAATE